MDDADGGRLGLPARAGPGVRRALWDHWGLGLFAEPVDLGGSSNLNLLDGDADRTYVVRVHRPHVTPGRLGAIHQARRALLAGGVPCAPPIPTLQGGPWATFEGRLVEVEAYVDHDAVMDCWQRLEAGMALLAHTHNLLRYLEVAEEGHRPRFANHLESVDVAAAVRRGVERIRRWDPTAAERRLAAVAEELAELVTQAEAGLVARLPRQLVHGDFWDNNVLFRWWVGGLLGRRGHRAPPGRQRGSELAAALEVMSDLERWRDAFALPATRRSLSAAPTTPALRPARPDTVGGADRPAGTGGRHPPAGVSDSTALPSESGCPGATRSSGWSGRWSVPRSRLMGKAVRVGVLGLRRGAALVRLAQQAGMQVVAVCERDDRRLKEAAKGLGVARYRDLEPFLGHAMDAVTLVNDFDHYASTSTPLGGSGARERGRHNP